jgi:hypothetical protein
LHIIEASRDDTPAPGEITEPSPSDRAFLRIGPPRDRGGDARRHQSPRSLGTAAAAERLRARASGRKLDQCVEAATLSQGLQRCGAGVDNLLDDPIVDHGHLFDAAPTQRAISIAI